MLMQILILGSGVALGASNIRSMQNRKLVRNALNKNQLPQSGKKPRQKSTSSSLFQKGKTGLLAVKKVFSISITGGELRQQQLKQMGLKANQVNEDERTVDRNIRISLVMIGLSTIGCLYYAPVLPIAAAGSLYIFHPVFKRLSVNLKKRRITTELLEVVGILSFIITGRIFLTSLVSFLGLLNLRLLARTEAHSQRQLINIFNQKQQVVWVQKSGTEIELPLEAVKKHDIVIVNAGEVIPVDGIIVQGQASVDQQTLTGESQPIEKETGDKVYATTLVLSGRILVEVEHSGSDTSAAKIANILLQTQEFKEDLRLRGKYIADSFIAPTLVVSALTLPFLGSSAAMAILWSGFGYNMKLFGPISVLNFLHIMAENGILIKDGRSLEMLQKIDTLVFDKTGTLTMEQPRISQLHPLQAFDEETLLCYAAAAEYRQTHPVAKAILTAAQERGLEIPDIEEAAYQIGYGIEVKVGEVLVQAGSIRFMQQKNIPLPEEVQQLQTQCDANGHSLVYIAVDDSLAGVLELQPSIRPETKAVINYLKALNISLYIISGDHEQPTRLLAEELGIDHYYAETLPDQKAALIKELRARGKFVGYVGDGINDAIALKQANVSISLSGASSAAIDTAQIILMDGDLKKLQTLFEISQSFEANMRTNYLTSMIPGVINLGGVFLFHMGVVGGLTIYFSAKLLGLANSMLPLVKYENTEYLPDRTDNRTSKSLK